MPVQPSEKSVQKMRTFVEKFCEKFDNLEFSIGEVGFGRPCVGLLYEDSSYISWRAYDEDYNTRKECIKELTDAHFKIPDAYHKSDCIAVLVTDSYSKAIKQLYKWVELISGYDMKIEVFKSDSLSGSEPCFVKI